MTEPLIVEDRGTVRWVWFNRPEKHNAQNTDMLEALAETLRDVRADTAVTALVLAGKGRSFCSGHDLNEIVTHDAYREAVRTVEGRWRWEQRLFVEPVRALEQLTIPTIARVQGYCLAAGLMFLAAVDLVVATEGATFGSKIIPAMSINDAEVPGFSWLVGARRAKQALWLGESLNAAEAHQLGLVNWVVPADELDAKIDGVLEGLHKIPSETLALSKASFRFLDSRRGRDDAAEYHFMSHSLSHHTSGAEAALTARADRIATGDSPISDDQRRN